MGLRWDWKRNGVWAGFDDEGTQVAEVSNVIGPSGTSVGWSVHLTRTYEQVGRYYPSLEEGQAAADQAIDTTSS